MGKVKTHFKPDFFIPGAAKSGTSTLHNLLNTHPEISMSRNKEPVYWNNKSFDKFNDFEKNRYEKMFDMNAKIKGESTTSYMYYDSYLKNIKKNYEKSPKFIFILRNKEQSKIKITFTHFVIMSPLYIAVDAHGQANQFLYFPKAV